MSKASPKRLVNVRSLEELVYLASPQCLRRFIAIPECQPAWADQRWPKDDRDLPDALLQAIHREYSKEIAAAEWEAQRIQRMSASQGIQVLMTVAEQLHDNELFLEFAQQPGGQIGRAIWMRTHSPASRRLFEIAESILVTSEIRSGHRLYDAYVIPGEETPPTLIWSAQIKETLETQLMRAMRLDTKPDVVHVELIDHSRDAQPSRMHCVVVRFARAALASVDLDSQGRRQISYQPAGEATLLYAPQRKLVEVFAQNLALRAPIANVFARHGFKTPLSSAPLNRARYDLSAFTRPLKHVRPTLEVGKVERLYLLEAQALLGHASDTVNIQMNSGAELQDVVAERLGTHPFVAPEMLLRVTLKADVVFHGEVDETPLSITVAKPGRCSLQCERDPRIRQAGEQLLEHLGVCQRMHPGDTSAAPNFFLGACRLMELADSPIDGFALQEMGIDIEQFANEGILMEGSRITERVIECAPGSRFKLKIERCADGIHVRYQDPLSGFEVQQPAHLARQWYINARWLREALLSALGTQLTGIKTAPVEGNPVFMGEVVIDGHGVPVYFASRMGNERTYRVMDLALRLHPRSVPGIVLTSATQPFRFAGTNVVVPIEDVLGNSDGTPCIDHGALAVAYRNGKVAARGGASIGMQVSPDKQSGVLTIPGKAPWPVTGKMKIVVLERLVQANAAGPGHLVTKALLAGTNCDSLDGLFGNDGRWREYIEKVEGTRAWRLIADAPDNPASRGGRRAQDMPSLID